MFLYSGFALTIASEIEFPDLPPGEGSPDLTIRRGTVPRGRGAATLTEEFAYNTLAGRFHIRNGNEIVVEPLAPEGDNTRDQHALRVVLLGRIMAFLLRQRGWLPLHASGVLIDGQGVLFLGASGAGKSTAAAAMHAAGHMVITDDVAAVRMVNRRCMVLPAWPRLRLMDDSRAVLDGMERGAAFHLDKHTVDLDHPELREALPVKRIYVLGYAPSLLVEEIAAASKVALLSTHSFVRRRIMSADAIESHMRDCIGVAMAASTRLLVRPPSIAALPEFVRFVENDLQAPDRTSDQAPE